MFAFMNSYMHKVIRMPHTIKNLFDTYKKEKQQQLTFTKLVKDLSCKKQLNILFIEVFSSTWKYDSLYKLLSEDKRFSVQVLVAPVVNFGRENMINRLKDTYQYFYSRHYDVRKAYDDSNDKYIDVESLNPDIIFYSNPYKGLIDDRYYINQFQNHLCCYVPYGYDNINTKDNYNLPFHNLLWRYYLENRSTEKHFNWGLKRVRKNHKIVGYPPFDDFNRLPEHKDKKYKYIIWAPHHTLEPVWDGKLSRNSFLQFYQIMLELSTKYQDKLFVIFRPHPLLKNKLYLREDWGKDKTDAYYAEWASMSNTLLSETRDYVDDFALSDAMIHDCGSFTVEYLYTEKPVMFTGTRPNKSTLTPSAHEAFDCYQFGQNKDDIERFILDIIEGKQDILKKKKKCFKSKYLTPPNRKSAAQNIIDDIVNSIWKK